MSALAHIQAPTMSSREIAGLVGKEHRHVLRDIRAMLCELNMGDSGYARIWTDPQNGQNYPEFQLPKDLSITLVSGYSVAVRHRIVTRWQELEQQVAQPTAPAFNIPTTLSGALRLAAEQADVIEQQAEQLKLAAPAVEFVERYALADTGCKGFREVAKILRANEARFREFLLAEKILYRLAGALTPSQSHIDAGRFEVKTGEANGHAFSRLLFTPKGIPWVAGEWAKHQLKSELAA